MIDGSTAGGAVYEIALVEHEDVGIVTDTYRGRNTSDSSFESALRVFGDTGKAFNHGEVSSAVSLASALFSGIGVLGFFLEEVVSSVNVQEFGDSRGTTVRRAVFFLRSSASKHFQHQQCRRKSSNLRIRPGS